MSTDLSPQFAEYAHTDRMITVDYPKHWAIEVNPKHPLCVEFKSPEVDGVGALIISSPVAVNAAAFTNEQQLQDCLHLVLEQAGIESGGESSKLLYYPSHHARLKDGTDAWALIHEDLLIVIQVRYPESHEHIYRPLYDRMLTSLRINRQQQGAQLRLRLEVVQQLKVLLPDAKCELQGDRISLDTIEIGVESLEAMIGQNPGARDELIERYVEAIVQVAQRHKSIGQESWDEVQSMLYPMIRPDGIVHALDKTAQKTESKEAVEKMQPVASPWLANLVVCYAIDSPHTLRMVSHMDLERWGVDIAQLHDLAMSNLMQGELPQVISVPLADGQPGFGGLGEGGITSKSSYLLHPKIYEHIQKVFGAAVWAAIPNRDSLMIFSQKCTERSNLLEAVAEDFKHTDHALSDRIFEFTPDGVVLA